MPDSSFGLEWPEPCLNSSIGFWPQGWLSFRQALPMMTPRSWGLLSPSALEVRAMYPHCSYLFSFHTPASVLECTMQPWFSFEVVSAHQETLQLILLVQLGLPHPWQVPLLKWLNLVSATRLLSWSIWATVLCCQGYNLLISWFICICFGLFWECRSAY